MEHAVTGTCLRFFLITIIGLASFFVSPCAAQQSRPGRIGVLLPLSGARYNQGQLLQRGIALAKKEHPDTFNKVRVFFEDSRGDPRAAISGLRRLLDVHRVDIIIALSADLPRGVHRYLSASKVPLVAILETFEEPQTSSLVFHLGSPLQVVEREVFSWITSRRCRKTQAFISDQSVVVELSERLAIRYPTFSVAHTFRPSEFNFAHGMRKSASRKTDCVLAAIPSDAVPRFVSQYRSDPVGRALLLLQIGADVVNPKSLTGLKGREVATIKQAIDDKFAPANETKDKAKLLTLAKGYESAGIAADIVRKYPGNVSEGLRGLNRPSLFGKLSFQDFDSVQYLEISPKTRVIWNRSR